DVDLLLLDLAFSLERADARRHADGRRAARAQLRVHPRHDPRRSHVRRVGDVHAAGRAGDDRARARGLDEAAHRGRRLAALAGAMARGVELFERNFVNALDLFVIDFWSGCHIASLYSLRPIQVMNPSMESFFAACCVMSYILCASAIDRSRPPSPPMKFTMAGRFFAG